MGFTSREIRVYPFLFQFVQMFKEHFAEDAGIIETDRIGWFSVIFELSCIISGCRLDVRTRLVHIYVFCSVDVLCICN